MTDGIAEQDLRVLRPIEGASTAGYTFTVDSTDNGGAGDTVHIRVLDPFGALVYDLNGTLDYGNVGVVLLGP